MDNHSQLPLDVLVATPNTRPYNPRTRKYITNKKYDRSLYHKYRLSDYAYKRLIDYATSGHYVISPLLPRGLSNFINDLARCDFVDTRPPLLQTDHDELIKIGWAPRWYYKEVPFKDYDLDDNVFVPRRLALTTPTLERFSKIATTLLMKCKDPSPRTLAAAAIEAIGSGFLTPKDWPHLYTIRKYRGMSGELNWMR
jgi:hypothetical protein